MEPTLLIIFLYEVVCIILPPVLQLVLPEVWTESCNRTYLDAADNDTHVGFKASGDCSSATSSIRVGMVMGTFAASAFVTAMPIGWLVHRVNPNWTYAFGLLFYGIGCACMATSADVLRLSGAAIFCGTGNVFASVSGSTIVARMFTNEASRSRIMYLLNVLTTAAYVGCFFLGTRAYKVAGHAVFFASLAGVLMVGSVVYIALTKIWRHLDAHVETVTIDPTPEYASLIDGGDDSPQVDTTTYARVLRQPIALFAFLQMACVYWGLATVAATAPAWLQEKLAIGAVENGGILGVSSLVDCVVVIALVALVDSNRKRWISFMVFILLQAAGCLAYPFVDGAIAAAVAETAIRSTKAVAMASGPLVLLRIVDVCKVGTYSRVIALSKIGKYCGRILGTLVSPWLIKFFGFDIVYFSLSAILVPLGIGTVWYSKLS